MSYITSERHENAKSAWAETKHSCLIPVGRKRSLFFGFSALQRKVRFTANPFFEKIGTGSGLLDALTLQCELPTFALAREEC